MRQLLIILFLLPVLLYSQSEGGFGFRRFANKTALDAVSVSNIDKSASRRAYVHSTGLYYRWDGSAWVNEINIDTFSVSTDTLFLSIRNDGEPAKTVTIDPSITNEGLLTVSPISPANTGVIVSNTSGGNTIILEGGTGITITPNSATHTITIESSAKGIVDTVRTIDSLRIYDGSGVIVYVKDSPQNGWFIRLDNTVTDDGGILIHGTNDWGRYGEDLSQVNIKWFGAVGDSLTDDTGAKDLAVAYCVANPGSTLFFPQGKFRITTPLYIYKPVDFGIRGDGEFATNLFFVDCDGIYLRTDSVTYQTNTFYGASEGRDLKIERLSVQRVGTYTTKKTGVLLSGVGYNIILRDLRIEHWTSILGTVGSTGLNLINSVPDSAAVQHTDLIHVFIGQCDTNLITRLHNVLNLTDVRLDQANRVAAVIRNSIHWTGGLVQGSTYGGIYLDNLDPFALYDCRFRGIDFETNGTRGHIYKDDATDMKSLTVSECNFSNPGNSMIVDLKRVLYMNFTDNNYNVGTTDTIKLTSIYSGRFGDDNFTSAKLITSDVYINWWNGSPSSVSTLVGFTIGKSSPGRNFLNVGGDTGIDGELGVGTQIPLSQFHVSTGDLQDTTIIRMQNSTGFTQLFRSNATPEGDIAGNPGDFAYTSISSTGRWWGKATGTGNTGWVEFYTTGNLPSSVNIYTADGTTNSTERTVTLLDDINFIGASGTADFYVETGTTGGRLDVSVDSSRLYFTDGSGTNAVSSSATAVMLKTGTTDQVTILTDKINLVDASGTILDVEVKDDTRFKVDSLEDFAIGRWPNFPDAFEYLAKNRYGLLISDNTSSGKKTTIAGMAYDRTSSSYISSDRGSYQLNVSNYLASGTAEMVTGAVPNSFYNYNTHPLEPYDNIEMGFRNQWVGIPKDKTQYAYLYQGGDRTTSAPYDTAAITMWIGIPQITDTTSTAKSTLGTKAVSKVRGWGVQSLFHREAAQQAEHPFNWIKISTGSVAADTLLNGIQFYNNKYQFINSTPSPTVGDTSIMGWVGTGSVTTPIWLLKSQFGGGSGTNIYNSNGTTTANTRTATILESIRFVGTADFGQQYPFQVHSTGNEPPIQLWKGNTDSVYLYQSDVEYHFGSSTVLAVQSSEYLVLAGDSIQVSTLESKTKLHNIVGITNNNTLNRIQGTSGGQVLTWNASGYWEPGAGNGIYGGDGTTGALITDVTIDSILRFANTSGDPSEFSVLLGDVGGTYFEMKIDTARLTFFDVSGSNGFYVGPDGVKIKTVSTDGFIISSEVGINATDVSGYDLTLTDIRTKEGGAMMCEGVSTGTPAFSFNTTANTWGNNQAVYEFKENGTRFHFIDGLGTWRADNGAILTSSTTPATGTSVYIGHGMRRSITTAGFDFAFGESVTADPGLAVFPISGTAGDTDILLQSTNDAAQSNIRFRLYGDGSLEVGSGMDVTLLGQLAHASGNISTSGDAQASEIILRRQITGENETELFLDGSSAQAVLPGTNKVWTGTVKCTGVVQAVGNGATIVVGDVVASWQPFTIKKVGSSTTLMTATVGTTIEGWIDANMGGATFTISADDTTEALKITFTPPTLGGTTTVCNAVCTVQLNEIGF